MGYIRHQLVYLDDVSDYNPGYKAFREAVDALREEMPAEWKHLLVGPIEHMANGGESWAFFPDGSKEGWDTSNEGDKWRQRFIDACEKLSWFVRPVEIRTRDDGPTLLYKQEVA